VNAAASVTRKGLSVLGVALLACLASDGVARHAGLSAIRGVVWPTDLYAFQKVEEGPLDVVVMGSSRAAFALPPSALDRCLGRALGRPARTANLSRTYATGYLLETTAREVLTGERIPRILLIGVEPEMFDEHNPKLAANLQATGSLADLPGALRAVHDPRTAFAALHTLVGGLEGLALYVSGRWDTQPWLRWMMLHHGGGLYCYSRPECAASNRAVEASLDGMWEVVSEQVLPALVEKRFPDYEVGTGPVDAHTRRLLRWAARNGVRVALVELPRHRSFEERVPPEVRSAYRPWLGALIREHGLGWYDGSEDPACQGREAWVDPEHLTAAAAADFSARVCADLVVPLLRDTGS
jgi:hypothetical protein